MQRDHPILLVRVPPATRTPFVLLLIALLGACSPDQEVITPPLEATLSTDFSLVQGGRPGAARVRIRRGMDKTGWTAQGLFLMGLSYHHDHRYAKAAEWFERSIADDDIYPPSQYFLGWARFYLGQPEAAAAAFRSHLAMAPREGDSHFALGLIAMERGDLVGAERRFTKAIDLQQDDDPGRAKALARLGDVMAAQGRWKKAEDLLRQSVELNGDLYEAWYRRAAALRRLGRDDDANEALESFDRARARVRPDLGFPE